MYWNSSLCKHKQEKYLKSIKHWALNPSSMKVSNGILEMNTFLQDVLMFLKLSVWQLCTPFWEAFLTNKLRPATNGGTVYCSHSYSTKPLPVSVCQGFQLFYIKFICSMLMELKETVKNSSRRVWTPLFFCSCAPLMETGAFAKQLFVSNEEKKRTDTTQPWRFVRLRAADTQQKALQASCSPSLLVMCVPSSSLLCRKHCLKPECSLWLTQSTGWVLWLTLTHVPTCRQVLPHQLNQEHRTRSFGCRFRAGSHPAAHQSLREPFPTPHTRFYSPTLTWACTYKKFTLLWFKLRSLPSELFRVTFLLCRYRLNHKIPERMEAEKAHDYAGTHREIIPK